MERMVDLRAIEQTNLESKHGSRPFLIPFTLNVMDDRPILSTSTRISSSSLGVSGPVMSISIFTNGVPISSSVFMRNQSSRST